jgi:hypothetical protein
MSDIDFFYVGGGVTALTFVDSDGTGNIPGAALAGDIAVFCDFGGGSAVAGTPTGFTTAASVSSGTTAVGVISYKLLVSGDVGAAISGGISGALFRENALLVFRPDDTIDTVTVGSVDGYAGTGDPPDQVVSASGQATPLLVIGSNGTSTASAFDMTSSPAFGATLDVASRLRAGWSIYNTSPANHTVSATSGGGGKILQSLYIRVS